MKWPARGVYFFREAGELFLNNMAERVGFSTVQRTPIRINAAA
jgi:hypothetical protein